MNKFVRKTLFLLAILPAILGSALVAQENKSETPEQPTQPYIAVIPDFFRWVISVKEKKAKPDRDASSDAAGATPTPFQVPTVRQIVCTKTKDIKCDVITYTNGKTSEVWYSAYKVIVRSPTGEFSIDAAGGAAAGYFVPRMSTMGFYGVDWVKPANFVEKQALQGGREVYIYRTTTQKYKRQRAPSFETNDATPEPKPEDIDLEAIVDVESRLPLYIREGKDTFEYSYPAAPTGMLELPSDFQTEMAELKKADSAGEKLRAAAAAGH